MMLLYFILINFYISCVVCFVRSGNHLQYIKERNVTTKFLESSQKSERNFEGNASSEGEVKDEKSSPDIIYKRFEETYEFRDYRGACDFEQVESNEKTISRNSNGEQMLRVLMIGGGPDEALLLRSLSDMDELICGTYTSWDDKMGPLNDNISEIPYNNLICCENPEDPSEQGELAHFIRADVVIAGPSYIDPSREEFLKSLQEELSKLGIRYVSPFICEQMLSGDFSLIQTCFEELNSEIETEKTNE